MKIDSQNQTLTAAQALKLEQKIEAELSKLLNVPCSVYMALSGKFKVEFSEDENFITFDAQARVDWVIFTGWYSTLQEYIRKIKRYLIKNKAEIEILMFSYENRQFLQ